MTATYQALHRELKRIYQNAGLLDRPGWPTFLEFMHEWLPPAFLQTLIESEGGVQTPEVSATLETAYTTFIILKAGSPAYRVSDDLIRALRDTAIPSLRVRQLRTPFEGLTISVPEGTFAHPAHNVNQVFVNCIPGARFRAVFYTDQGYTNYVSMLNDDDDKTILEAIAETEAQDDTMLPKALRKAQDEAKLYTDFFRIDIFRFAVNFALYVTCPDADVYQDKSAQNAIHTKLQGVKGKRRREVLLSKLAAAKEQSKIFIVGANIRLQKEYTAALTESGKRWVLKHRLRVQGHWKMVACGAQRKERVRRWVSPYYKGPSYAEMVEKGYVVK